MGYTHYHTQKRSFTKAEWQDVCADIVAIIKEVERNQGIRIANVAGDQATNATITPDHIMFNGRGDDALRYMIERAPYCDGRNVAPPAFVHPFKPGDIFKGNYILDSRFKK
jgi:hypothetical protein